ncbi:uncharacterized protein LOC133191754 [Saccostrea echinata]|uniref:uncharacterized protein LOC133191754 n=1 Tax=Saccostrea echinata TaxID=191078 RepID=UPI002A821824|nr:uncharacterized protein LOC133191754 [Saccostrea echinata]
MFYRWLVFVVPLLDFLADFCVGFDVCNTLIQVEHDRDENNKVLACRYEILKYDPSGVFIRETVSTPVNQTLCHELRSADTCKSDGTLVTCHHVPEWERYPVHTFLPPAGCTFSQNVQCELETICPSVTEKPATVTFSQTTETTREEEYKDIMNNQSKVTIKTDISSPYIDDVTVERRGTFQDRVATDTPPSTGHFNNGSVVTLLMSF